MLWHPPRSSSDYKSLSWTRSNGKQQPTMLTRHHQTSETGEISLSPCAVFRTAVVVRVNWAAQHGSNWLRSSLFIQVVKVSASHRDKFSQIYSGIKLLFWPAIMKYVEIKFLQLRCFGALPAKVLIITSVGILSAEQICLVTQWWWGDISLISYWYIDTNFRMMNIFLIYHKFSVCCQGTIDRH